MAEKEQTTGTKISNELLKQFPDQNPKIAALSDDNFTYELENHGNFTYYVVRYAITGSGDLKIDWDSTQLTVI